MNVPRRSVFTRAVVLSVAMAALVVGAYSLTGRLFSSGTDFNGLWGIFPFVTLAIAAGFAVLGCRVGLARPYTWAFGVAASLVPLLALYSAYSSTHYIVAPDRGLRRVGHLVGVLQTVFADRKSDLTRSMAVDAQRVYWAGPDHTLMATAKDGSGHAVELARSNDFITSIQLSNTDVLWLSQSAIYRVSKDGGASARLATQSGFDVRGFAVGAAGVFACIF